MDRIEYAEKYFDDIFEYRHVTLPRELAWRLPRNRLLSESEWRAIGVQQSPGWIHYDIHRPEPQIMLFRRPLNYHQLLQQQEEEEEEQNRRRKRMRGEEQSASEGAEDQIPTK